MMDKKITLTKAQLVQIFDAGFDRGWLECSQHRQAVEGSREECLRKVLEVFAKQGKEKSKSSLTITWGRWKQANAGDHPAHTALRNRARAEKWVGTPGIGEFVNERYNAKLIMGKSRKYPEINGLSFKTLADKQRFLADNQLQDI